MRQQFWVPKGLSKQDKGYGHQWALVAGNWTMLLATAFIVVAVILSYGYEQVLSIPALVFWHSLTIVCAGLLKVGYLLRCAALKFFGSPDF
ncbi:hypothetical protein [Pseudoteredinibacter isoporae]|uniref:hypothetical protein n=1 Tax=Pseudoteredinibacter isoporae TaxID=570281 RepID=UPI00310B7424